MSFDYEYKAEQLEEYVRNDMGEFTRINLSIILLALLNGSDHIEHIRDWIDEYTKEKAQ
jgi:hypothetical protein